MLDYLRLGEVPPKHHTALRRPSPDADGCPVYYEHCVTRRGFDGGYSILYRDHNPAVEVAVHDAHIKDSFEPDTAGPLRRRHFQAPGAAANGTLWESLRVLVGNDDIRIGTSAPTVHDSGLVQHGDGDVLLFVHRGHGTLDSEAGSLAVRERDYVWIPRGLVWRLRFDSDEPLVMVMECLAGLDIPQNFRNPTGQLKMDAPYSHRDFRRPTRLSQPSDDDSDDQGHYVVLHKRGGHWTKRILPHHPFDVVGWDGTVYPVAFNIHDYQPKTGLVHLPPPIHTTFVGGRGSFVVCSFVPRRVDYHPDAIPCPYPHSSVDCDEVLWYVDGNFTSRKGVGPGSVSLHPAGIPHAPQPGKYEASMGTETTDELAVMVDTFRPLVATRTARLAEDAGYHGSWAAQAQASSHVDTYVD